MTNNITVNRNEGNKKIVINTMDDLKELATKMEKVPDKAMDASVAIELIEKVQGRDGEDEETIVEYAERQEAGDEFPSVEMILTLILLELLCYNGIHRIEVAKRRGKTHINATIRLGTREDAEILAAGANVESTKPRSPADKRAAVRLLLSNPKRVAWSNNRLSEVARVSAPLVDTVRQEMEAESGESISPAVRQVFRGGKSYEMKVKAASGKAKKTADPLQPIVAKVLKAAKDLDANARTLLSEKLASALKSV
jgi:hypothetical protein